MLRHTDGFLIEAVAETVEHAVDDDLAVRKKGDAEHDVALDVQLASLGGILHGRLGEHFDARGLIRRGSVNGRSGNRRVAGHAYGCNSATISSSATTTFSGARGVADAGGSNDAMRSDGRTLQAAIRIAESGDGGRTHGVGIGRDSECIAEMNRCHSRMNELVLRGHGCGQRWPGPRRERDVRPDVRHRRSR